MASQMLNKGEKRGLSPLLGIWLAMACHKCVSYQLSLSQGKSISMQTNANPYLRIHYVVKLDSWIYILSGHLKKASCLY